MAGEHPPVGSRREHPPPPMHSQRAGEAANSMARIGPRVVGAPLLVERARLAISALMRAVPIRNRLDATPPRARLPRVLPLSCGPAR
jgi:hypothetical protein